MWKMCAFAEQVEYMCWLMMCSLTQQRGVFVLKLTRKVWLFQIKSSPSPHCRNCWTCTSISRDAKPANCFSCTRTQVGRLWQDTFENTVVCIYSVPRFVKGCKSFFWWWDKFVRAEIESCSCSFPQFPSSRVKAGEATLKLFLLEKPSLLDCDPEVLPSTGSWHFPQKRSFVLCHCCSEYIHSSLQLLCIYTTEMTTNSNNFIRVYNQTGCFEII